MYRSRVVELGQPGRSVQSAKYKASIKYVFGCLYALIALCKHWCLMDLVKKKKGKNFRIDPRLVTALLESVEINDKQHWAAFSAACLSFLQLSQRRRADLLGQVLASQAKQDLDLLIQAARVASEMAQDVPVDVDVPRRP